MPSLPESLTPVRIRGKRKPASSTSSTKGSKRPRGRPLSKLQTPVSSVSFTRSTTPASETSMASLSQKRGASASLGEPEAKKTRRRRKLAPLEQMPAEILQEILLLSLNPEMPLASPVVAAKVDSEHVQMEFAMRAIYRTGVLQTTLATERCQKHTRKVDSSNVRPNRHYVLEEVKHSDEYEKQRSAVQTQLMRRRFFTADFFRRYIDKAEATWDAEHSYKLKVKDLRDFDAYREIHGFADGAYMPEKFLRGPFDQETKLWFAEYCLRKLKLDAEHSTSEETLREVLCELSRGHDCEMLHAWLHFAQINGIRPTTEMLKIAVLEAAEPQPAIVQSLLEHSTYEEFDLQKQSTHVVNTIDMMDPELWTWIDRRGESARWFRDLYSGSEEVDTMTSFGVA